MQKHKTLTFTGHRPESLPFGENELSASAIRIKTLLADEIMRCAAQGYDTFLAGGARGGDILFAEQVLFVKGLEYPDIRLITVVPMKGRRITGRKHGESGTSAYWSILPMLSHWNRVTAAGAITPGIAIWLTTRTACWRFIMVRRPAARLIP